MTILAWHWKLKEDGVKVWSVSSGFLTTDLGGAKKVFRARGVEDPARLASCDWKRD
ncbi:hypothetical protein MY5147_001421 [Beauveria neobassiana]